MSNMLARTLAVALALGTAACADTYGYDRVGYRYGYDVGLSPYWGWYGDYYYPGTGYFVYDRYRRPFRWDDRQQRYWLARRQAYRGRGGFRDNWYGFTPNGNGYRYRQPTGRAAPPYRDNGYRVRSAPAVPGDAVPPAYRTREPMQPRSGEGRYRRPGSPSQPGGMPRRDGRGRR